MDEIRQKLSQVVERLFDVKTEVTVTVAPETTGADYASNIAMQLAKLVHKNPMVIAEMLKAELSEESLGFVVSIAAPGFLNFTLDDEIMIDQAKRLAEHLVEEARADDYDGKNVVAEFSDPNPFKVLHVGHLYTSIVGDSISRLLEFAGAKVVRANFGGDVGLHVAKTIYMLSLSSSRTTSLEPATAPSQDEESSSVRCSALSRTSSKNTSLNSNIEAAATQVSSLETADESDQLTIEDIAKCYVEGTRAYEEDESARAEITKLNKKIYQINAEDVHDSEVAKLYWCGRELSYEYFDEFYGRIGVKFDKYYPESAVAERGLLEVRAHTGTTYEESDGAVVYKGEKVGLHTRVFINREGVPTYEAKDVGLIFTKWDDWHFDESIVVTGNEQSDYMKVVLASVSEYAPQLVDRTTHLTHGLVKLPGNVKMSSRKGNFLKAVDVLEMICELVGDEQLALAAIKYAFLKYKMGGDIVFDPQESVSTTGNSGIYLLYSAVRAKKILEKCKNSDESEQFTTDESSEREAEKLLSKNLVQYKDVLQEAVRDKAPYKVCNYLYELAQEFSRFYEKVRVAGNPREEELLQLVKAYLAVMEHGLDLLGIKVPESM